MTSLTLFMDDVEVPAAFLELDLPVPPPEYDEITRRFRDACGRFVPASHALQIQGPSFVHIGLGSPFSVEIGNIAEVVMVIDALRWEFKTLVQAADDKRIVLRMCGDIKKSAV